MEASTGSCGEAIRGTVFSGRGEGSFYVSIYARNFRRTLGINPYPGTLNVRIDSSQVTTYSECIRSIRPVVVDPPRIPGARLGAVKVYRAELMGIDSWIVRPDITVYRDDVAEFISSVYLRRALRLRDGDRVEFIVRG